MSMDSSNTVASRAALRVGDVQRGEYAERLADAFARGELSRLEFDARTELCLAAVTDADLARLVADLPDREPHAPSSTPALPRSTPRGILLAKVLVFELLLIATAYVLGVDLESELRSWHSIALHIWVVGNLAGVGGALILRSSSTRAADVQPGPAEQ